MEVVVTTEPKTCKSPVKSLPPAQQHPDSNRPDVLAVAQPTVSKHWKERVFLYVFARFNYIASHRVLLFLRIREESGDTRCRLPQCLN